MFNPATGTVTSFVILVPSLDDPTQLVHMGEWFTTHDQAANALRGWRPELQAVAQITAYERLA